MIYRHSINIKGEINYETDQKCNLPADGSGSDIVFHFYLHANAFSQIRAQIVFGPSFTKDIIDFVCLQGDFQG